MPARVNTNPEASLQLLSGTVAPAFTADPAVLAVLSAVPTWWKVQARRHGLSGRWADLDSAIAFDPPFHQVPSPPLESSWGDLTPSQLADQYLICLDDTERSRQGKHYTPDFLAKILWQASRRSLGMPRGRVTPLPGLIRDPACGAGALLLAPLREHIAATRELDPRLVLAALPSLIEGVDIDPVAVWLANVVMAAEMLPLQAQISEKNRRPLPSLARVGNSLEEVGSHPARAIIMNPPYAKVKPSEEIKSRFSHAIYGHVNLYGLFLAHSVESVDELGVVTALVPTSFTAGKYFSPLRHYLTSEARLKEISFVGDRSGVFTSVLQETCVATFTKRQIQKTDVRKIESEGELPIAVVATPRGSSPWILPRRSDLAVVAARSGKLPDTLRSLGFRVSTGPLVWNRKKDIISSRPEKGSVRIIWAADFESGAVSKSPTRADKRYINPTSDSERSTLLRTSPCVLIQRTTSPEQRRRLVVAELTASDLEAAGGSVAIENHVNTLTSTTSDLPLNLVSRLLSTQTLDNVIRCIAGSVALSAYEVESLPVPDPETLAVWGDLDRDAFEAAVSQFYTTESSL